MADKAFVEAYPLPSWSPVSLASGQPAAVAIEGVVWVSAVGPGHMNVMALLFRWERSLMGKRMILDGLLVTLVSLFLSVMDSMFK